MAPRRLDPDGEKPKTDTRTSFDEHRHSHGESANTKAVAAKLRNPLAGMSEAEVLAEVDAFVNERGLQDSREAFHKGALVARMNQTEDGFERVAALSEAEKVILRDEVRNRWRQPKMLYFLCALCAGSAIVQG